MPQVREAQSAQQKRDTKYRNWDDYEDNADSPFKDLLQRDGAVCDHCFTLRYIEVYHEWWRGSFGWSDFNMFVPLPGRNEEIPADEVSGGMRLACQECGHRKTKHRPIPKDRMPTIIQNISDTLTAKGISHDYDVLRHEVNRRNTSNNQGRQDSHVFKPAVELAIEYATDKVNTSR